MLPFFLGKIMNSDDLLQARTLLNELTVEGRSFAATRYMFSNEPTYQDNKYSSELINWMNTNNLIVLSSTYDLDSYYTVEIFSVTELGTCISWFLSLTEYYNAGVDGEDNFRSAGQALFTIMNKYNETELEPLISIITVEEQEAYQHFYRTQIWDAIGNRGTTTRTREEALQAIEVSKGLLPMFEMSVLLGARGTDPTRTNNYVFKKCMEELGEMALEDQIENGLSYKDAGSDGVAGEAVDLAICAMDMFALQHGHLNPEEIQERFIEYMNKKLNKWKSTLGK
ncbi:hypothetical protein pEaSNUABM50_00120 [Erwinia phage pEa_SNUABM_50]|uniref:Uncharacterized protein n=2 Tax=Eneladusvirus BF TaxID=2560751 RepID=A0A7L8ZNU4_9CAUD|nr:hypothetical protein pEaSNUABM12_00122 [Erwinia phage pEa_SNUABM_12]QOI72144.1 hypothetical protein pEaSNUABM50_00120 [Erwinia phage pEa_SNUABM_50]QXO11269.1 hypothetical protein pEaSNUABM19_00123 [Erwinia phage pEa_SNUABM_19]